jgi:hypothetical protein
MRARRTLTPLKRALPSGCVSVVLNGCASVTGATPGAAVEITSQGWKYAQTLL